MNMQLITITAMTVIATASTLIPHPPNFTPIAAIALFAGAHFTNKRAAVAFPLAILLIRDLVIGLHSLMPFTYACFALTVGLGFWLKRANSIPKTIAASLVGSTLFFLVTNFGVWLLLGTFPPTTAGLIDCYVAAIPYFRNTLAGDLLYVAIMFGTFAIAGGQFPELKIAPEL
jgi:hypothetical protein